MHPNNKYNCSMPEDKPDNKIAPKRKREEVIEGPPTKKANTNDGPTITPAVKITPVSPASSAEARAQFRQRVGLPPSIPVGIPTPDVVDQAQQIRMRLSQHHQMKQEGNPSNMNERPNVSTASGPIGSTGISRMNGGNEMNATPNGIKQEPTASQTTRVNSTVAHPKPQIVNLDSHECNGCEAMCQKMSSLCNALGANIQLF